MTIKKADIIIFPMKNYLTFTKKLNIADVGFDGKTSVADIMNLFQQAVTLHTYEMELDFESIRKKYNGKWFILSARFEIEKRPSIHDTIEIETWPLKASALKFPRAFKLNDSKGNTLVSAMTHWCIVDYDTEEIFRSSSVSMPFDEFITDDPTTKKCSVPNTENDGIYYSRKMMSSDIDLNRHVNNVSYIRIALDCFKTQELENLDIKSFDIQYRKQCFEGDVMDLYRTKTENGYVIEGKINSDTIFKAAINIK